MKKIALIILLIAGALKAQVFHEITIDAGSFLSEPAPAMKPGIFYFQFWLHPQNINFEFISSDKMYNSIRDNKFEGGIWKNSKSLDDVFLRMADENYKEWLTRQYKYTDNVVVKINSMPKWLSSSDDETSLNDKSWAKYMTLPPKDHNRWEKNIEQIVKKISGWGFHPYYEIWNEPDGEYWQASDDELLELYRITALAIKRADPDAKVGGFGMHSWWKSADPLNSGPQKSYENVFFGKIRKDIAYRYSILVKLLDSVNGAWKEQHVPLDFISYHYFRFNTNNIKYTADMLREIMLELGYCPPGSQCKTGPTFPELYISEWQTTYGIQEKPFQPPLFLKAIKKMSDAGINMHSIAAINDFTPDIGKEFSGGWGLMTQNGFIKPVYKSLLMLNDVISHGKPVEVISSDDITGFSSYSKDTLRVLLSNYSMPPVWTSGYPKIAWSSFERLLYEDDSKYIQNEISLFKYTSIYWGNSPENQLGTIDSVFQGYLQPHPYTPQDLKSLLLAARQQWIKDSTANNNEHHFNIEITNVTGPRTAYVIFLDSTKNNIIHTYDSLVNTVGLSNTEAVELLKSREQPGGYYGIGWDIDTLHFSDGRLKIPAKVNSVVYIQVPDLSGATDVKKSTVIDNGLKLYPQPAGNILNLVTCENQPLQSGIEIYDITGNLVMKCPYDARIDISRLKRGTFILILHDGEIKYKQYFIKN